MKFDKTASGGGVEVTCRLENGKAFLEWEFHFMVEAGSDTESETSQGLAAEYCATTRRETEESEAPRRGIVRREAIGQELIRLCLIDAQENMVLECVQELHEEERLQSVLLHPQLWNGTQNPYLYTLEVYITDREGRCFDQFCARIPLRSMEMNVSGGLLLNGQSFAPRAVAYSVPDTGSEAERQRLILEDLQQLRKLGANCIYIEKKEGLTKLFLQLCERLGFFVLSDVAEKLKSIQIYGCRQKLKVECQEEIPLFKGESNSLFMPHSKRPTSLFYKYMARWSREPFVYIVPESVKKLQSGKYTALCYSSCSRVALYSDGILFEFQKGEAEFEFQEIPAKSPCIMLTAEGDGCCTALSIHKTFVNQPQNGLWMRT